MIDESVLSASGVSLSKRCTPAVAIERTAKQDECRENDAGSMLLVLELTRQCNLQCEHCYVSASPEVADRGHVPEESWVECLEEGRRLGMSKLQFIGGEPTLHPILGKLIDKAGDLEFSNIELFSNATRIGEELWAAMKRNRVRLATAMYGGNSQQHDKFTGVRGSFVRTSRNIRRALATGVGIRVGVVYRPGRDHVAEETLMFLRGLGVRQISVDVVRAFGRGTGSGGISKECEACGVSVLRVCSDGSISGCSMSVDPLLGHVKFGIGSALSTLSQRQAVAKHRA